MEEAAASVSNGLNREHDDSEYELLIQFKILDFNNFFEFSTIFHN
jgi:hypothetical protein